MLGIRLNNALLQPKNYVILLNNATEQFVSQLREFGLLDSEHNLKLRNIEYQFGDLISMSATDPLKKLFDSINNLLDSVLGFVGVRSKREANSNLKCNST
jgi:hypothetical protein